MTTPTSPAAASDGPNLGEYYVVDEGYTWLGHYPPGAEEGCPEHLVAMASAGSTLAQLVDAATAHHLAHYSIGGPQ